MRSQGIDDINIIAVSMVEFAQSPREGMIQDRELPLVQDNSTENVGEEWDIVWRDLYILDGDGKFVDKISLTSFDPDPDVNGGLNYMILKQVLLNAR